MNIGRNGSRSSGRLGGFTELRVWVALTRHAVLLYRTGLLRFRLETFGTYYPRLPYSSPFWLPSAAQIMLLLSRARSYGRWLVEMEDVRRHGAGGWWQARHTTWECIPDD